MLNVDSIEAVEQAILKVWASTYSAGAIRYGFSRDQPVTRMAVVIQEQVDPLISGVLFTRNPVSGNPEIVVECCQGLSERLVSGEITPMTGRVSTGQNRSIGLKTSLSSPFH